MPTTYESVSSYQANELTEATPVSSDLFFFWSTTASGVKMRTINRSDLQTLLGGSSSSLINVTTSRSLAVTDVNNRLLVNSATPVTLTIPTNATTAISNASEIKIIRYGAGAVAIAPASGVTIRNHPLDSLNLDAQYASAILTKISTDEWLLEGRMAAL